MTTARRRTPGDPNAPVARHEARSTHTSSRAGEGELAAGSTGRAVHLRPDCTHLLTRGCARGEHARSRGLERVRRELFRANSSLRRSE